MSIFMCFTFFKKPRVFFLMVLLHCQSGGTPPEKYPPCWAQPLKTYPLLLLWPLISLLFFLYPFYFVVSGNIHPFLDQWHEFGVPKFPALRNHGAPCLNKIINHLSRNCLLPGKKTTPNNWLWPDFLYKLFIVQF